MSHIVVLFDSTSLELSDPMCSGWCWVGSTPDLWNLHFNSSTCDSYVQWRNTDLETSGDIQAFHRCPICLPTTWSFWGWGEELVGGGAGGGTRRSLPVTVTSQNKLISHRTPPKQVPYILSILSKPAHTTLPLCRQEGACFNLSLSTHSVQLKVVLKPLCLRTATVNE